MPLVMRAQDSPLDGYTTVSISQSMFELFSSIANDKDDQDFKNITSRLTGIKILSCEAKGGAKNGQEFYHEVIRNLPQPEYQVLMDINDGGEPVKFLIKKQGNKTTELVMAVGGAEPCLMVLQGDIDLKQISKLSKSMNIKGFDHLGDVAKHK